MTKQFGLRATALGAAACVAVSAMAVPAVASKRGDKVAAGVAGAVIGGIIGAAAANASKYPPAPSYQPYQPGYAPAPYPAASPVQTCIGYGNKYSQKSGALGIRLDSVVSVTPTAYNQTVVGAYMTVLWPATQRTAYVTCTVTNGVVTSWLVA